MENNLRTRLVGEVTIIEMSGRLTLGFPVTTLRDAVTAAVGAGRTRVLLQLAGIEYIDSAGIGEVVWDFNHVAAHGGSLRLLQPSKRVQDLLRLAKVFSVFTVFSDEAAGVGSFSNVELPGTVPEPVHRDA